jgi:2-deoxy-D-gluconate 3-dehydrogenase
MILDKFRLDGKVALVTGGTKGLGKAAALALAEAGADIAIACRTPDANMEKTIFGLGRRYVHHSADLMCRDQTRGVIPAIMEEMGDLDILVNNAGIIRRSPALQYAESDWDAALEVDLTATFILSQAAGQIMTSKRYGKIINIASILAFQGGLHVVAYSAAKHAIAGLTKALANEWASKGINVNAIAPGFFETELTAALREDPYRSESITARTPVGRWGIPEDIAGAVVFLASSSSDFVHGVVLPIDGGWMAW